MSMALPSIWDAATTQSLHSRLEALTPATPALWGTMNVAQMLAHCCFPYEQIFGDRVVRPPLPVRFIMKLFFKSMLTNEVPYKRNQPTAPQARIADERDFERERERLRAYIVRVEQMGAAAFEQKEQVSLGRLTSSQWNNLLFKHLDHHLRQFGV
jgi:hypothetical protein